VQDSTSNLLGRIDQKIMVIEPGEMPGQIDLPEAIKLESRDGGVLRLSYSAGKTKADEVIDAVRGAGVSIRDVRTEQADLQDVFLEITRSR